MTDRIDILVSARNQTSGVFNQIKQEMRGLDDVASQINRGLSGIGAIAGIGAVVAGIQQIGAAIDELGRRGAVFEQIGSVLDDFAASVGTSSTAMVEAGRRAAQGTISDFELILNANRAIQFEVAQTADQYAQLIELATALGRAQGISDTQALEFITTGIARESRLILDNLGLIIDLDEATENYAASLGKQSDQLTTAERKQALLAEAFRQGSTAIAANKDAADSAATQFERLDANSQNLKDTLGQLIAQNSAGFIKSLADAAGEANNVLQGEGDLPEWWVALGAAIQGAGASMSGATTATATLSQVLQVAGIAMQGLDESTRQGRSAFDEATDKFMEMEGVLPNVGVGLQMASKDMDDVGRSAALAAIDVAVLSGKLAKLAAGSAGAIVNAAKGVAGIVGNEKAQELAEQQLRYLQEQTRELEKQGVAGLDLVFAMNEIDMQSVSIFENIEEADRAAQRAAKDGVSAMKKAAQEAAREFDVLQGKVSGVLQEALNVDVGVDPSALLKTGVKVEEGKQPRPEDFLLPRQDAINEEARRLADIAVKGFESPWLAYFEKQWPELYEEMFANAQSNDSVRKTAALLLQNFEDGLNPELIDKERAKDRVRRMLLGEQNIAQLAQEIASELSAEFGGSISLGKIQATASAALGVDGGNQVQLAQTLTGVANEATGQAAVIGSNIRTGIVSALDGIGETVAIALDKQFRAENNLKVVTESGRVNGEAWGSGFLTAMDSLTNQVLEKLAGLVTPYVEAAQARTATLNGAN